VFGDEPKPAEARELAPALNEILFEVPPLAVDAARREVFHLGERVAEQVESVIPSILEGRQSAFDTAHANERLIDEHHASIVGFVEKLLQPELPRDVARMAIDLVEAADYLESIGDLVDKEMIPLYLRHAERGTPIGAQAREHLRTLAETVGQELRRSLRAVADADQSLARAVLDTKPRVRSLERAAIEFQIEPQLSDDPQRILPSAFERELTESLRRMYSLVRRFVRAGTDLLRKSIDSDIEPD
jgi:phosphate:Na+ symporter